MGLLERCHLAFSNTSCLLASQTVVLVLQAWVDKQNVYTS